MDNYSLRYTGEEIDEILEKADLLGPATEGAAGLMSAADKAKLNSVSQGAQANVIESIRIQGAESDVPVSSKKATLPVDSVPTGGSKNLVLSGVIAEALSKKAAVDAYNLGGSTGVVLSPSGQGYFVQIDSNQYSGVFLVSCANDDYSNTRVISMNRVSMEDLAVEFYLDPENEKLIVWTVDGASVRILGIRNESPEVTEIDEIPSAALAEQVEVEYFAIDADLVNFITRSVDDLLNYYTKNQTYTKAEVNSLVEAIKQFTYQVVATLPTASADTMNIIFLVPSSNPATQNVKDEFITIRSGSEGAYTYSWEQIGSTEIDLSGYSTTEQMNAAISAAVTAALGTVASTYATKTEVNQLGQEVDGLAPSKSYAITQGVAKNTANSTDYLPVSIPSGTEFEVLIEYEERDAGTSSITCYLMDGNTVVTPDNTIKNKVKKTYTASANLTGIGFNLPAAAATVSGTIKVTCLLTLPLSERIDANEKGISAANAQLHVKVDGRASTNLFDKDAVTTGYYVNPTDGVLKPNANYSASDFIPVVPGEKISAKIISNAAYFDKNKNYLASAGSGNPNTVPSGAAFIRVSVVNSSLSTYHLNKGTELLPFEPFRSYLTPDSFDDTTKQYLKDLFGVGFFDQVREHLDNPFIRTQIKLVGDSITAGQGGTGYSPTGETIGGSPSKANVLTAICWSNMLYHYIDDTYNRDVRVEIDNNNIVRRSLSSSVSNMTVVVDGVIVITKMLAENNTVAGSEFLSFTFFGDHFSFRYVKNSSKGIFEIYVDDELITTVDAYSAERDMYAEYQITSLAVGTHTISFRCTNSRNALSSSNTVIINGIVVPKTAIVKPWGISGTESGDAYNTTGRYSQDDDFVILEYGTNDRHTKFSPEYTIDALIKAGELIRNTYGAIPIFMCAPPCAKRYEDGEADGVTRYFHMWDVHDAICRVGGHFNAPIIDNYTAFQEYAEEHNITTDSILADGLHPNDLGYKVMFMNIMKTLGLARQPFYYEWPEDEE